VALFMFCGSVYNWQGHNLSLHHTYNSRTWWVRCRTCYQNIRNQMIIFTVKQWLFISFGFDLSVVKQMRLLERELSYGKPKILRWLCAYKRNYVSIWIVLPIVIGIGWNWFLR
jgi:linoleoyl-CoA desaturase